MEQINASRKIQAWWRGSNIRCQYNSCWDCNWLFRLKDMVKGKEEERWCKSCTKTYYLNIIWERKMKKTHWTWWPTCGPKSYKDFKGSDEMNAVIDEQEEYDEYGPEEKQLPKRVILSMDLSGNVVHTDPVYVISEWHHKYCDWGEYGCFCCLSNSDSEYEWKTDGEGNLI